MHTDPRGLGIGRGARDLNRLAEFTYIRSWPIVIPAVVALLVAAPFAAQVFDRVEPFDISDPGSEVQRAYAVYESATGQQVEREVILLVQPDRERRPPGSWPAGSLVFFRELEMDI